jgi:predicted TIM-barrel fold metal-dependent hydrolase
MRLIDMDSHFSPVDEFDHVADDLKLFAPAWLPQGNGRLALVTPGSPEPSRRAGSHAPSHRVPGNFDPEVRLRDMDAMGIEMQLLNPEFGAYAYEVEPRLAAEMCRSANFAVGKALKAHPDRFIGSAVMPTQSMKATLEEANRAREAGFQTFFIKSAQGGKNLDDQHFWPLWDFTNEHNIPFSVHANGRDWGTVTDPKRMGSHWGFFVATLADYCTAACSLIYSGVFDTFPNLKFCLGEGGATWLPWLYDRIALTYDVDTSSRKATQKHPTEYLQSNIYVTVDPTEASLGHLCERFPATNLMLGTDYPHGDITGRGHPADKVGTLRATHIDLLLEREDLSQEAKENIAYKNALTFLGGRVR